MFPRWLGISSTGESGVIWVAGTYGDMIANLGFGTYCRRQNSLIQIVIGL